jgi:hypothetical protein
MGMALNLLILQYYAELPTASRVENHSSFNLPWLGVAFPGTDPMVRRSTVSSCSSSSLCATGVLDLILDLIVSEGEVRRISRPMTLAI